MVNIYSNPEVLKLIQIYVSSIYTDLSGRGVIYNYKKNPNFIWPKKP